MRSAQLLKPLALATALTLGTAAHAGPTLSFVLDQSDAFGNGTTYGTVLLTQVDADTVDVQVKLMVDWLFINTGGPHTPFAFNVEKSPVTVTFVTPPGGTFTTPSGSSATLVYNSSGGSNTPFGSFGDAIDSSAGNGSNGGYKGTLDFHVKHVGGISTLDFLPNAGGYYFSADVSDGSSTGAISGKGPGVPPDEVPAPGALALGLLAAGALLRSRRRA